MTAMVGNEGTAAFFGTLGLALFIANECRERPTNVRAAASGLAIGIGMLTKVSAVLVLGTAGVSVLVAALQQRDRTGVQDPSRLSFRRNASRATAKVA